MSKDKKSKISEFDKKISEWEEKLSIAIIDKNKQAQASAERMIKYWKSKKAE